MQPDQALFRIDFFHAVVGVIFVELLGDVVVGHQRHAGVFPHHVQLSGFMGAACQAAAQTAGYLSVIALAVEVLGGDFCEQGLLGKHPRTDADGGFFCGLNNSCEQQDAA